MAILILSGSVGKGGKNNPDDVKKVVDRLVELGYTWVRGFTKGNERELVRTIGLFQSICKGKEKESYGDGKISLHGTTHKWLAAHNAPKWVEIFGKSGLGWVSTTDMKHGKRNGGYCTSWLQDYISVVGFGYWALATVSVSDPPPLWIRDCSPEKGGDATGHRSHETGIDMDIRLPLLPPHTDEWIQLKEHNYTKLFHVDAAMTQCKVMRTAMSTRYIFFNDPRFIKAHLTTRQDNHSEHYHVRIKPPVRIDGTYM